MQLLDAEETDVIPKVVRAQLAGGGLGRDAQVKIKPLLLGEERGFTRAAWCDTVTGSL